MMSYSSTSGGETSEVWRIQSRTPRRRTISKMRGSVWFINKGRALLWDGSVIVGG